MVTGFHHADRILRRCRARFGSALLRQQRNRRQRQRSDRDVDEAHLWAEAVALHGQGANLVAKCGTHWDGERSRDCL